MEHINRLKRLRIDRISAYINENGERRASEINWFFCIGLLHRKYKNYLDSMPVEMVLFFLAKKTGHSDIDESLNALRKSLKLLQAVKRLKKLSRKKILSAHSKLVNTKTDTYRKTSVTLYDSKNEVSYRPVPYQAVNEEMTDLIGWFNNQGPSIERAIIFFWSFVNIHPFEDGNGRTARLLAASGLNNAQVQILSLYFAHSTNRFKQNYLLPMNRLQRDGDIKPLEQVSNRALIKFTQETDRLYSILIEYEALFEKSCRQLMAMDRMIDSALYEEQWNQANRQNGRQLKDLKESGFIEEIEIDGSSYITMKKITSALEGLRKSTAIDLH